MTNYNAQEILNQYNEEEQVLLRNCIRIMAIVGRRPAPETAEEFINWCNEEIESDRKEKEEKEARKTRRINKEIEKAQELGLTLEEYKEYKGIKANRTRYINQIKKLEKELTIAKRNLVKYEKKLEKFN